MIKNNRIISLDDNNFDEIIKNQKKELILIDFWADWCNPCKTFFPVLEEIAIEYYEKMKFGKLNVDGNPLTVKKFNIRSIPTLLLFQDSMVIATKIGVLSKKQVQEFLDSKLLECIKN